MNVRLCRALAATSCTLALCLGMAGCGGSTAPATSKDGITVNATSKVKVVPDICSFSIGITERGDSASAAQSAAAVPVKSVLDTLKEQGVDDKDVQTTYSEVSRYWNEDGESDGWEARTSLLVSNVPVEKAGGLMQAVTDAGATETSLLDYQSTKYTESYQQALEQAIADTRPKAEAIAAASGARLGKVTAVTEGYENKTFYAEDSAAMATGAEENADKGIELAPGEVDITADVTVTYAIN